MVLVAVMSCEKPYLPVSSSDLVVEGWIEDGRYPVVIVTRSVPVSEQGIDEKSISDYIVTSAKVTVDDGDTSVILTGRGSRDYFTAFAYTTSRIRGVAGKTYTVTVESGGDVAKAVVTIPETPVMLDSLACEKVDGDLFTIKAYFRDDPSTDDCYRMFYKVEGEDSEFFPCFMGAFSDEGLDGEGELSMKVLKGTSLSYQTDGGLYFRSGDHVEVKLCSITKPVYEFWSDYESVVALSRNPLFPLDIQPRTNMSGAFGYWAGYNSSILAIDVR